MKTIGVDLGGSKVEVILFDDRKIKKRSIIKTMAHTTQARILKNILDCIEKVFVVDVKRIGVGIPGIADSSGKILDMPNVKKLVGVNVKKIIQKRFKIPVVIENDANCFALAEYKYGAGKHYRNVVAIIFGTGIGAGLVLDGKLYRGSNGGAGEIGYNLMFTDKNKLEQFEHLCSAGAIVKKRGKLSNSYLNKEFYRYLAINLANIINTLDPDIIVIGGGLRDFLDYKLLNILLSP